MQLQPTSSLLTSGSIGNPALSKAATAIAGQSGPVVYSPIGFAKQIYAKNGVLGFWHAVGATGLQRMWFGVM